MRHRFLIYRTGPTEGGAFADGSADSGILRIGTVFTEAQYRGMELVPREGETKPIHLTVVKILAYGHELDEIYAPMSMRLFLQGEGAEELASGVFIFYNE